MINISTVTREYRNAYELGIRTLKLVESKNVVYIIIPFIEMHTNSKIGRKQGCRLYYNPFYRNAYELGIRTLKLVESKDVVYIIIPF